MAIIFVTMVCLAIAAPLVAFAWAMKPQQCPNCGSVVKPDEDLVRMFSGR